MTNWYSEITLKLYDYTYSILNEINKENLTDCLITYGWIKESNF